MRDDAYRPCDHTELRKKLFEGDDIMPPERYFELRYFSRGEYRRLSFATVAAAREWCEANKQPPPVMFDTRVESLLPKPPPSETLRAHPGLMKLYESGGMEVEELERRARGAERLKEAFSSIPWHTRRAEKDPDYWSLLYDSRVNW
ncbi:hypothetical protein [Pikeienuella sp. HZG-20]|uniref:hypothetical protein n=1 Tax=Paludibacillus litoralis TaxID=3133267 RepID=UPI0030ECC61C